MTKSRHGGTSRTALPPLEHREQSGPDRQRSQLSAIRSRKSADRTKRKSSSAGYARLAKEDPAAEYVDSPMMTKRLRSSRSVSAEIAGRYGAHRTRTNPDSFLDVEAFLRGLDTREKAELIETIGKIVVAFPQTLGLFGVAGFDETDDDDDGWAD